MLPAKVDFMGDPPDYVTELAKGNPHPKADIKSPINVWRPRDLALNCGTTIRPTVEEQHGAAHQLWPSPSAGQLPIAKGEEDRFLHVHGAISTTLCKGKTAESAGLSLLKWPK